MAKAILFDLYGTLIELTTDAHPYTAIARSLRHKDRALAIDAALTKPGMTLERFAERCGVDAGRVETFRTAMEADLAHARVFDDVHDTLRALRDRGLKLALVSNLAEPYKEPVRRLGLEPYFDVLVYSCDVRLRKPDPRIYGRALSALGREAHEAVMVGDSYPSDVAGPEAVGIAGIHLTRSGQPSRAQRKIASLSEVVKMVS